MSVPPAGRLRLSPNGDAVAANHAVSAGTDR